MKSTAEKIKKLRKELGLTQEQFAKEIGVKRGVIAQIETEKNKPTLELINKINSSFSVNLIGNNIYTPSNNINYDEVYIETTIDRIEIIKITIEEFAKENNIKPLKSSFARTSSQLNYYEKISDYRKNQVLTKQTSDNITNIITKCYRSISEDLINITSFHYNSLQKYFSEIFDENN